MPIYPVSCWSIPPPSSSSPRLTSGYCWQTATPRRTCPPLDQLRLGYTSLATRPFLVVCDLSMLRGKTTSPGPQNFAHKWCSRIDLFLASRRQFQMSFFSPWRFLFQGRPGSDRYLCVCFSHRALSCIPSSWTSVPDYYVRVPFFWLQLDQSRLGSCFSSQNCDTFPISILHFSCCCCRKRNGHKIFEWKQYNLGIMISTPLFFYFEFLFPRSPRITIPITQLRAFQRQ